MLYEEYMRIDNRDIPENIKIIEEKIEPIKEEWVDGSIRETDNLIIRLKIQKNDSPGYFEGSLYFYDKKIQ